jgi:uncharacterized protein (TIGR03083 family)
MPESTATAPDARILAAVWRDWAERLRTLDAPQWATPTRCGAWTVAELAAHVSPDVTALRTLEASVRTAPAAVDDASALLRRFNEPGGVAHRYAPVVAEQARARAEGRSPSEVAEAFAAAADVAESLVLDPATPLPHPMVGSVTAQVLVDVSLLEATVHLLDLVDAIGGAPPRADALDRAATLLVDVVGAVRVVEAATGRTPCAEVFPAIR